MKGEAIPTSIEFLKSDESKILVAYNNGSIKQFDILSGVGRIVYDDEEDDCFINSICSSSINSNLLLALNNKKLKVIDLSTGLKILICRLCVKVLCSSSGCSNFCSISL